MTFRQLTGSVAALPILLSVAADAPAQADAARAAGAVDTEHGIIAVARELRGLGSIKRVLVIGAHPDDEDSALLAVLERGMGADAAYLSLTRGEGGQNLIGSELGVALGLLRTEELLAARRIDGAEQYFTRAYDFGYSKSADETFRFWPRDSLLADVVLAIRRFRPQVIVTIFSGTPRDGHGQHRAAGMLAREAYEVAGDPGRFGDLGLAPWNPSKLYRSTRFDSAATTLTVETGRLDMLYGRSYHQMAMAARSQHRSQDMGRIEGLGPQETRLQLLESRVDVPEDESSLFDGIDTTLVGRLEAIRDRGLRGQLAELLTGYGAHLRAAREALGRTATPELETHLATALATVRRAREATARAGDEAELLRFALGVDEAKLETALAEAAGVIVGAFADDDLLVPGQRLAVEVAVWNAGQRPVELGSLSLETPAGWEVEPLDGPEARLAPASLRRLRYRIAVPAAAAISRPYYLQEPRAGALYRWPDDTPERGRPRGTPPIRAELDVSIAGQQVRRRVEVVYRFADQARGEIRRRLAVVPAVGVSLEPRTAVLPLGSGRTLAFGVTLRGEAPDGASGRLRLEAPGGWTVAPSAVEFDLDAPGATASFDFAVEAPDSQAAGAYRLQAVAESGGRRYTSGYTFIDYDHVRRSLMFSNAEAEVEAFDVIADTSQRVAYVAGAARRNVVTGITSLGLPVDVLTGREVETRDLSRYEVIVIGPRAYETNPALVAANGRYLEWTRRGGTLIVQYQQYGFFRGGLAPYPLRARFPHDRVSDEGAPVNVLVPDHPLFNRPNRIDSRDFEGWVQERGLYFASEWDERYQPLLETADPGEEARRGGLLVARYGDGLYVYTGLSLFRQLPAGVPGAYRLLANLLSLAS
ncbi:MAG: PIG-L family deacetylase [Gemmatimonadetes bacterium]|uniref:PIG-L family deacetylase n=1 Tax=Candidatus Kutchimonas denitrificans TaxID=3056748 RepID=A0AAE5CBW0_9BACT|nr:PIG-L family deacetylase [Gemmatimonadota bacterium]NIR74910.1 PIG-L family deacetylase [Candidatus Kutchimonas denitrificans]NIS00022.1 PIG-L family deacetylase [Gemmatimonadota bacterium]NIT65605.1 PIG-L family deacetylase [Gemmatimonadota bacterium]NIU52575.1 hypothetical protein [Gemmatimonadota bacterium]